MLFCDIIKIWQLYIGWWSLSFPWICHLQTWQSVSLLVAKLQVTSPVFWVFFSSIQFSPTFAETRHEALLYISWIQVWSLRSVHHSWRHLVTLISGGWKIWEAFCTVGLVHRFLYTYIISQFHSSFLLFPRLSSYPFISLFFEELLNIRKAILTHS